MAFVTVIVMLVLVEYLYFGVAVGRARVRHGVEAPAVTGDEHFERFFRAHQNTLEQVVVFVPAVYAAAYYSNELAAAGLGLVFLVSRVLYFRAYIAEPAKRGPGMIGSMGAVIILIGMALIGATRAALIS